MGAKDLTTPKLETPRKRGKITAYPDLEIERLYQLGQDNGWDTPKIVREAITRALVERKDTLLQKADEAD